MAWRSATTARNCSSCQYQSVTGTRRQLAELRKPIGQVRQPTVNRDGKPNRKVSSSRLC
jgi:hypothetical protein